MPTVEFSPVQLDRMARASSSTEGIFGAFPSTTPSDSTLAPNNGDGKLVLFSGTIPAQPRLMTASDFSTSLIFWNVNAVGGCTTFSPGATTTITTIYRSAHATGTATWFALCYYTANPPSTGGTLVQRIIGTVGTIGSGEDLEMTSTSVASGSQYRIFNFRLTLPSTYTY